MSSNVPIRYASYNSNTSSHSSPSLLRPKRSSLKPSLKSSESVPTTPTRRSSPPTVRFADPEPLPKSHTWPRARPRTVQLPEPLINRIPNSPMQAQHENCPSFVSPTASLTKQAENHGSFAVQRPVSLPTPPSSGTFRPLRKRMSRQTIAPASPQEPDPRWSGIPLPAHFTPPTQSLKSRASFQSTLSTFSQLSTQSAPSIIETPAAPQGQFNPLEHYIPCLYPSCKSHYTPAHLGPHYYLPQGPYALSRLPGYCPRHASRELKEATQQCKREYEHLRQTAGRKTLNAVAAEFEDVKAVFRASRNDVQAARLARIQKRRVLGAPVLLADKSTDARAEAWDWRYTPRPCTSAACNEYYSPYSNHLYAFYRTPLAGTAFFPQQIFCPKCAQTEVETFEQRVKEKWGSRCGWDGGEWAEWYANARGDREMELEYWLKAQEGVVKEKGPARWVARLEDGYRAGDDGGDDRDGDRGVRKNIFSRVWASMVV
ncbi:hypothetical protein GMOD_00006298 [Pyrenophora seminiperda CCB06]|uniref:Uncharacterized protein n=1 Tax=Pyrenophora seminiperda CCB06 TaxID=1302712 RepID=A0A3M7M4T3_9PLEO|nr:hypothetical protein GMOD_00006298 [Pyrenophora seminiperda CCB06]